MVVRLLLERGIDPNLEDANKVQTLLSQVAEKGDAKLVQLFIDSGINLDRKDDDGRTPLSCAVVNGHEAVVALLLEKGFDPNTRVGDGPTVLDLALEKEYKTIVEILLENGAIISAK